MVCLIVLMVLLCGCGVHTAGKGIPRSVDVPLEYHDQDLEHLPVEHRSLDYDLPLEHRALTDNILANIPAATDNSFVWRASDGSYRFGMKGDDQWRVETRDREGSVQGQYFYRTPNGGKVHIRFNAGPKSKKPDHQNQQDLLDLAGRVGGATDVVSLSLLQLHQKEGVLPYGALKIISDSSVPVLRMGHIEDHKLQAIVTDIHH